MTASRGDQPGDRVRLEFTSLGRDTTTRPGVEGKLKRVMSDGCISVAWDDGSDLLELVPGEDTWTNLTTGQLRR